MDGKSESEELRRKAEEQLSQSGQSVQSTSDDDAQALVHELQVHQIELEMQNEELQYAKAEAENAARRYSDLYNFAPVGYLTTDDKGVVVEANLTAGELLGLARSALIQTPFRLFVLPKDRPAFDSCRNTIEQKKTRQSCELVLLKNRKEPFHALVVIAAAEDSDGAPKHNRITITDISQRKQAEEALRRAHDELEDIVRERTSELTEAQAHAERHSAEIESFIASLADGLVLLDPQGNITFMNDVGMDILGVPPGESFEVDTTQYRILTTEGQPIPEEENAVGVALRGEKVTDMRIKAVTPWGKEATLSLSASPVLCAEEKIIGATVVFRDQSGRVAFEKERQELLDREQHIADVLQKALIPTTQYNVPGCEIVVRYEPAFKEAEVGGDFYDVFVLGDGKVAIVIGDVAGKGLAAAISVAAARHSIRSYAYIDPRPSQIMTLANAALCRDQPEDMELTILTAFIAVIDTHSGVMTYANGGHESPLVRRANGYTEKLEVLGCVMGVASGFKYPEGSNNLHPRDVLVMVTDGITEAHRHSKSLFGIEGVERYLLKEIGASPKEIADGLLRTAKAHAGGELGDDAVIVVATLRGS